MPNKTIYVSDSDLPLFEKAQELYGSNLSSTIVRVLRRAIEHGNKRDDDESDAEFHDVIIESGQSGCYIKQRFTGRLIAKWRTGSSSKVGRTVRLYETANGRYALYTRSKTNWENYDWNNWGWYGPKKSRQDKESREAKGKIKYDSEEAAEAEQAESGVCTLEVFESFEAFKERVPENIREIVEKKLAGVTIEDLDI